MSNTDRPDERPVPAPNTATSPDEVSIRRAPRFGVFIVGGAVLGFLVTLVVVALTMGIDRGDQQETTSFGGLVGYFSLYGVTIGMFLGAVIAVVLDRVFSRRATRLTAERVAVEPTAAEPAAEPTDGAEPTDDAAGR